MAAVYLQSGFKKLAGQKAGIGIVNIAGNDLITSGNQLNSHSILSIVTALHQP